MYWKLTELDAQLRGLLAAISTGEGRRLPDVYFRSHHRPGLTLTAGVASLAVASFMIFLIERLATHADPGGPLEMMGYTFAAVATGVYGLICLAALGRTARCAIKPFVLVTPAAILRVGRDHPVLEGFRLRDATKFQKVAEYAQGKTYTGNAYNFVFPEGRLSLKERGAAQMQRLEAVLDRARSGGAKADDPLLPDGGRTQPPGLGFLLDPFSAFWIQSWVFLAVIALMGFIFLSNQ